MVTMLMIYAGAKELYEAFNLEPKNDSYPVAAALVVFAIGSARPFHFYFDVIATCSVRKFSWVAGMSPSCLFLGFISIGRTY
jgi:hypothetical protein